MYFRYYRFRKTWLVKCLKSRFSGEPSTHNKANGSKHCCNLSYGTFTIFLNHCEGSCFGKVSFSNMQNPKSVNTLTADDKNYLLNRVNLTQPVQMQ